MDPQARTTHGWVSGRWAGDVAEFLGLPYAEPPVGELRLRPPRPPARWAGVRPCHAYGPAAPQPPADYNEGVPELLRGGDDYLNLNVFTPDPGGSGLPVLVWLHGGGFAAGGNASPWYHGGGFARSGVVLVTPNYRLGPEGFLPLAGGSANLGVRDWVRALEWVAANIAAFGGDPGAVTVGGQSAGGQAAVTLLAVPAAAGLFHRVIDMSGGSVAWEDAESATAWARRYAGHLGVPPTREAFAALDPRATAEAHAGLERPGEGVLGRIFGEGTRGFNPFVDGEVVAGDPLDVLRSGTAAGVPLLVGSAAEEFNEVLRAQRGPLEAAEYAEALRALDVGPREREFYEERWPAGLEVLGQVLTDRLFRVPTLRVAQAHPGPVHLYDFRWRSPANGGATGAGHCVDLPFVFDCLDAPGVERMCGPHPPAELAARMHGAWAAFVRSGDPGWPRYGEHGAARVFDVPDAGLEADPLREESAFWPDLV
ncbi:carboxylesterase family protein [Nonomuraea sp. NPDC050310]|uniref:carboxylesterase/lipase family protein n=1 Tax=unclassified Nonomuraea TaxID=2593643 RepID=UPI0033D51AA1